MMLSQREKSRLAHAVKTHPLEGCKMKCFHAHREAKKNILTESSSRVQTTHWEKKGAGSYAPIRERKMVHGIPHCNVHCTSPSLKLHIAGVVLKLTDCCLL